jgi:hypothetical protein
MSDGPTRVNSGGGGTAIAVILGIIAVVALLFFTGVININRSGGKDVDVTVNTPKVEAPSAPSISKPAAPAKPAPATNGG